ncbi:Autophagy-related protein 3 [Meloidogyne graminicola]|uniref:Ubiquitin-like-conjugating enzyme ATG3 n=1 Tax=Meloidogyne graminicola TaxID=189291 RepID=A0A8T0A4E2_9BILA|nr:Autophagy-related protein 3 [Meloidogyne graminicola]
MNDLVNQLKSTALSVGQYLTPVLRESKFKETGVLTPEEFVAAGDHLVHLCPTWSWAKASDSNGCSYLPPDKQFLITKQVPCHQRCAQIMGYDESKEKTLSSIQIIKEESAELGDEQNEWVDTHHFDFETNYAPKDLDEDENKKENSKEINEEEEEDFEEGDAIDLDEYLSNGLLEDEDPARFRNSTKDVVDSTLNNLLKPRRYDLYITYDKYYQVPRFWLVGYDENGSPLAVDKMKEDFSQDHADKTITLESHPHISGLILATIHPCRHAPVMKRLIEQFQESGKELLVIDYLFIFLKFVQAVIPTVEYDYTRSIHF